ncbi:MAG: hypothetical protein BWY82_02771 [Verrucomicrobia bacterium ADurb.Bin474]|nr:MAG: hypothetical protein BWY82_02771 [Verrucomicrobia bacterium ADurb.Bin474]
MEKIVRIGVERIVVVVSQGHIPINRAGDPDQFIPVRKCGLKTRDGFSLVGILTRFPETLQRDCPLELVGKMKPELRPCHDIRDLVSEGGIS